MCSTEISIGLPVGAAATVSTGVMGSCALLPGNRDSSPLPSARRFALSGGDTIVGLLISSSYFLYFVLYAFCSALSVRPKLHGNFTLRCGLARFGLWTFNPIPRQKLGPKLTVALSAARLWIIEKHRL